MIRRSKKNERRRHRRTPTDWEGSIRAGKNTIPCRVKNISWSGALLAIDTKVRLPLRFQLVVESQQLDLLCEIRRYSGRQVAVVLIRD